MPSPITKALEKLHLRRTSASGSSSPPSSPGRRSEDNARSAGYGSSANASRQSLDQGRGSGRAGVFEQDPNAPPVPVKQNLFTSQTGDYAPGQPYKQVGDTPLPAHNSVSPATIDPSASGPGGKLNFLQNKSRLSEDNLPVPDRRSSVDLPRPPVAATTRATGDEVAVPYVPAPVPQHQVASAIPQGRRRSLSGSTPPPSSSRQTANNLHSTLPRSPAKFALPTIPPTPATEEADPSLDVIRGPAPTSSKAPQLPPLDELGVKSDLDLERSVLGSGPVSSATNAERKIQGAGPLGTVGSDGWVETGRPLREQYDLRPPSDLFPVIVAPGQGTQVRGHAETNAAYASTHVIGYGSQLPTTEEDHQSHISKHLALLPATIFGGIPLGSSRRAFGPPGKILPLQAGPAVPSLERDRVLTAQRQSLVTGIAEAESRARSEGLRAGAGETALEARTKEVFERYGWGDRLGVMDTVDVGTRILEPVVQEHIRPVETVTYLLAIEREVHQYHIYPYIQPIRDPDPIVLPTRHLFKDAEGNWREIIGDAEAEIVLGGAIDRSEGQIFYERWIEGVDGIEYQMEEENSVKVGRSAWVQRVGERVQVLPSRVGESRLEPLPYQGVPASATTIGRTLEEVFGPSRIGTETTTASSSTAAPRTGGIGTNTGAGSKHTGYHVSKSPLATSGETYPAEGGRQDSESRIGRAF